MSQKFYSVICQSCGMPMKIDSDFGTNTDKSKNEEYCTYCYQQGAFTNPNITIDQMITACVGMMVKFGTPEDEAKKMMQELIPTLKRWKK
ncbi:transcriptional regulator [Candidatus Roizmanbacteria bacterium RIFOXYB2_FULL_38_10]|uniref:Transcriptional regulator n=1 Tax=Candidatus Roizmanbacteria bacterium RIFOXYD1_FULL_38_12 TaxID=1802093 RepID=A0A1F7L291_9BACT|nr:MAG: transcriptional regulator [Candidatus Roizmanbacteria bacterium RIFOXYA2_FULL_38_14]OGK64250.1 MAG: transcriptional regulator [Candidatus Roizmanbacteria bacterium RIFOXYA1_FULL_37_12]OGK66096.1 MAG: transcriptional regulator [Candidatus Roizmanbacteria bacterium RIFOXYB1_FULL_40_23]OGK67661.1 MAG: transcriptional regulator [Candidatus Roizmanbacteria bacterium RIFOXYB2_FULL_38_10]OGK70501.1 MAG: transcriptional regulator [Candidatus Roizmanbacteria bacterium RIFOXYC1_FULL_38_14]OGK742